MNLIDQITHSFFIYTSWSISRVHKISLSMASKLLILSVCLLFVFAATFEAARLNSKAKCGGYGVPTDDVTLENYKQKVDNNEGTICNDLMCYNDGICYRGRNADLSICLCQKDWTGFLCRVKAFKPIE